MQGILAVRHGLPITGHLARVITPLPGLDDTSQALELQRSFLIRIIVSNRAFLDTATFKVTIQSHCIELQSSSRPFKSSATTLLPRSGTMYEDWFAAMAKDPDMPTPEEVNVIKEFIDGKMTADAAAKQCTSRISLEETNPDPTLIWSLLEDLAVEFFETQDKVVELLTAIKRLPDPIRNGKEHRINSQKTFSDLGYFRADFGDYFRGERFQSRSSTKS